MPKIAEALVERKALQDRLNRVNARLVANARVQEGDRPSEPPSELLEEGRRILSDIKQLTMQINRTNIQTPLPGRWTGRSASRKPSPSAIGWRQNEPC